MGYKLFRDRLDQGLNMIGMPQSHDERIKVFAKLFKLSRHTSSSILSGIIIPDNTTLDMIAEELEVSVDWLLGKSDKQN